jgi:outer membrane protein
VIEVSQARQATARAKLAVVQATGGAQKCLSQSDLRDGYFAAHQAQDRRRVASQPDPGHDQVGRAGHIGGAGAPAGCPHRLRNAKGEPGEFPRRRGRIPAEGFLTGTSAWNSGNLNVTALPSIGSEAPTVNLSGNRSSSLGASVPLYDAGVRAARVMQAQPTLTMPM